MHALIWNIILQGDHAFQLAMKVPMQVKTSFISVVPKLYRITTFWIALIQSKYKRFVYCLPPGVKAINRSTITISGTVYMIMLALDILGRASKTLTICVVLCLFIVHVAHEIQFLFRFPRVHSILHFPNNCYSNCHASWQCITLKSSEYAEAQSQHTCIYSLQRVFEIWMTARRSCCYALLGVINFPYVL
jgi:hypothetical protein